MRVSRGSGVCVCVVGVLGDLLPWPIKQGFAFDCVLKETDEPAELLKFLLCVTSCFHLPFSVPVKRVLLCTKGSDSVFLQIVP